MICQNLKSIFVLSYFLSIKALLAIENCPNGWLDARILNMGCLNFNGTKSMAWNDAQDFCHSLNINSHLVEIFSEEQQQFMVIQALLYEEYSGKARNWWIGLTDEESEGQSLQQCYTDITTPVHRPPKSLPNK